MLVLLTYGHALVLSLLISQQFVWRSIFYRLGLISSHSSHLFLWGAFGSHPLSAGQVNFILNWNMGIVFSFSFGQFWPSCHLHWIWFMWGLLARSHLEPKAGGVTRHIFNAIFQSKRIFSSKTKKVPASTYNYMQRRRLGRCHEWLWPHSAFC